MANPTERIGVHHCAEIAERSKWMFREQPINDIGIDAHIEFVDSSESPKQLLALQIKSGVSWFKEFDKNCFIFRDINERQYNYWTTNSLPCIIVLYNPETNLCIWERLSKDTIKKVKTGKGYFVKVPTNHIFLDSDTHRNFMKISNLPEHVLNYNFLLSQKEFMEIIAKGGIVKLHSFEWVNKSSGRGDTELIVDDGKNIKKYCYPYWFPYTPYTKVFPRLFPWATFTADEEFYEDSDRELWQTYNCFYDKEEGNWIVVGESFDEFRKGLDSIRSINHQNEVAEYMLKLELNDIGKAFLKINDFVSIQRPYTTARPELLNSRKEKHNEKNKIK